MKKLQGFTLIELMVVMAIIAILATAGLSAYTGYIKKARDTKRISDLSAINTIVLADMAADGLPPTKANIIDTITAANNGKLIEDPLLGLPQNCLDATGNSANCAYYYFTCDNGTGYALAAFFESTSNTALYANNASGTVMAGLGNYDIGSCRSSNDGVSELISSSNS